MWPKDIEDYEFSLQTAANIVRLRVRVRVRVRVRIRV